MISKIVLSCIICIVIILTVIVINYAVLEKVDVKEPILDRATPTRTQSPPNRLTRIWILKRA
jgi:hypothetical protein